MRRGSSGDPSPPISGREFTSYERQVLRQMMIERNERNARNKFLESSSHRALAVCAAFGGVTVFVMQCIGFYLLLRGR